jgi:dTDP-4-amino-4,6-dideoxygalactose transaminase
MGILLRMSQTPNQIPMLDLRAQTASVKTELLARFSDVLDRTAYCLGPEVQAFESEFAGYCGAAHGVGVNSGTSALHVALLALGVKAGDEVVTTPYTFIATAWAITYCGATPVFADIDPGTFLLDPKAAERAITPRTKAILAVHLYGQPVDLEPLLDLSRRKGLPLVEDAAQAHGAAYKGRRVGSFGAAAAFSFYPTKNLGACGEGGMVLTQDAALAARMKALRDHGSVQRYHHDTLGFNYRLEGLQAAALRVKLPHLDAWNARRQQLAGLYAKLLEGCAVKLPRVAPDRTHVYHLYVILHPQRDSLAAFLQSRGIGFGTHYTMPIYMQRAYAHLGIQAGLCPRVEQACRECLSLPMFPELRDEQVRTVADAVRDWERTIR